VIARLLVRRDRGASHVTRTDDLYGRHCSVLIRAMKAPTIGIAAHFERGARRFPSTQLTLDRAPDIAPEGGTKPTFRDLYQLVLDAAAVLAAAGVVAGQRVVVIKRNNIDVLILAAAANRIGAVPALLSPRIDPDDIELVLARLAGNIVITDSLVLSEGALSRIDPSMRPERFLSVGEPIDGTRSWASLRGGPVPSAMPPTWHEPMLITHTSGTTGVPKLVLQSAAIADRRLRAEQIPLPLLAIKSHERVAVCLQLSHARCVAALMLALDAGIPVLALSEPDIARAGSLLADFKPTIVETHPNIFLYWQPLADDARRPFAETRMFVNTFDAIHPSTVLAMLGASRRRLPLWLQGWGQSEAGATTFAVYTKRRVLRRLARGEGLRDIGFPRPGWAKVRILHPDTGLPVRRGEPGQLHVTSKSVAITYVGEEALFSKRLRAGEWSMGDIGRRRWHGGIELLDRHIDQVEGIESCIELEDLLLARLPQANEVVVLGDLENCPRAVVCTHGNQPLAASDWAAAVTGLPRLGPPLQLPWERLPRTGTWKVRRQHLRKAVFGEERAREERARSGIMKIGSDAMRRDAASNGQ
jgi:acyl-coenzyme A synthetase/AMP-(fatty) acid ligase